MKYKDERHDGTQKLPTQKVYKDPVCGMDVTPGSSKEKSEYEQQIYYFCSANCKVKFELDPKQYVALNKAPPKNGKEGVEYTCPMHSQVRQIGPGNCPICGMALEPVTATAVEENSSEYRMMLRRFWISVIFSVPLLFITMGGRHLIPSTTLIEYLKWIELALASPVVLWGGWPFFVRFWESIKHRNMNMFTLIALGVGVAYIFSVIAALFPGMFPPSFRDSMTGEVALYFEAAAVIVTLVLLGQVLELKARGQTGAAIKALLRLAPKTARRITDRIRRRCST
jgi:Cu+-exporting ATPase